mgnify:CR=1 FL=1
MALPKMNVPQYKIELPSTGEQINMRPYLVKEEKVLMIALESNDPVQISEAVRNIIMSCYNLDSLDKLTVFDIEYLFLMLRAKSVGEKMNLQIKCNEEGCDKLTPITIDVADVEIINKNQDRNILLDDKSGIGVVLNYPSMEMIANLDMEKLNSSEGMMDIIMESIDSIYDEDNVYDAAVESKEELTSFFDNLSGEQYKKIMNFFRDVPAVYYKSEYDCICGKKNDIELRGLNSFFT